MAQERDSSIPTAVGQNHISEYPSAGSTGNTQYPPIQQVNQTRNVGNLLQQLLSNTGGIPSSARGRDSSQRMGIPGAVLGNIMGQVMQNPFMRNVVQQVVEQVGEDTVDGGFPSNPDFSELMQQMMPVVGQALSRINNSTTSNSQDQGTNLLQSAGARIRENVMNSGEGLREGPNLSALFQQIMPVVSQAFGGNSPVDDSRIPANVQPASDLNIDGDHQVLHRHATMLSISGDRF